MRMDNALSSLVGEELEGDDKWDATVAGKNGFIYGIPFRASQVAKFNPVDKSMIHIGPDFGEDILKWRGGAITNNGIIYCVPYEGDRGILKIDTNTDNVTELNVNLFPERGNRLWMSCAAALDGCIYFMPGFASHIMKLDPNNNDEMTSVGDESSEYYCIRTIVGIDGCVYGIPEYSKHMLKYDPTNDTTTTSFLGEEFYRFHTGGVVGRDGCIYAVVSFQKYPPYRAHVFKIEITNNSHCFVGNDFPSSDNTGKVASWGDGILGIDGCIYWPPNFANRILKYDPYTNQTLLVGDDFEDMPGCKWHAGALASDRVIYFFPSAANHILSIDPLRELSMAVKSKIEEHPQEFGFLFQETREEEEESPSPFQTHFDHAVIKFGQEKVLEVLEEHMEPVHDFCKGSNLYPFMIVASSKESTVSAIHHFLCHDLSWVTCISSSTLKKRKHNSL